MIVVLPFHQGDLHRMTDLLLWCQEMGGCPNHCALLVADCQVQWDQALALFDLACGVFKRANIVASDKPYDYGWSASSNAMWTYAAKEVENTFGEPWLWLEADAIPVKPGWADQLDDAYQKAGKPFVGAIVDAMLLGQPCRYLNGVAIYPKDAHSRLNGYIKDKPAFDVAMREVVMPEAANTPLIHCHWGLPDRPPVFGLAPDPNHVNVVTLDFIRKGAVLFHRNKDGSLLRVLRAKAGPMRKQQLLVVLPFCNKDGDIALKNIQWMGHLHGKASYDALLCYPRDTGVGWTGQITEAARRAFANVKVMPYRGRSMMNWPEGANQAFQAVAREMMNQEHPWFWIESDAIPLKANWLDIIAHDYPTHGKRFYGPIVPHRGHMNGVGIYPPDTALRCPNAMKAKGVAWDYAMMRDMISDCYDASNLIQHCWGIVGGKPHPTDGPDANFNTQDKVNQWVAPSSVLFHRCKDGSLIDRLMEREHRHTHSNLSARQAVA